MSEELVRMLRYAADCEKRGWLLPANISSPLRQAGLVTTLHQGWGVYAFEFTEAGRAAVRAA